MRAGVVFLLFCLLLGGPVYSKELSFRKSKKLMVKVFGRRGKTFYCGCDYNRKKIKHQSCGYKSKLYKKRSRRLEWEHIVPAHAFGQSFKEWREGHPLCKNRKKQFKGRKCARKVSAIFREMEGNPYNLRPAVGSINAMRSNFSFEDKLQGNPNFGKCEMTIIGRKASPPRHVRGDIARIYFYMDQTYPARGIISAKRRKLFNKWAKLDPVSSEECLIYTKIKKVFSLENEVMKRLCEK